MAKSELAQRCPFKQRRHASGTHHNVTLPNGQKTALTRYQSIHDSPGRRKMINRQQGFTLLEVMGHWRSSQCLACWRLWFFRKRYATSTLTERNPAVQSTATHHTILDNDLLQLVARRNRSTDKSWCWVKRLFLPRKVAIRRPAQ